MQYKCQECNDTGSSDKSGDYLDCGHCDAAMQRKALNDWMASQYKQGAIAKVDGMDAWLIHQRALAMAPKQEAPAQEPVAYLRFRAAQQWSGMGGHDIEHCEWLETCQAHEVGDDKLPAFPVYSAPAAANGTLTDDQINTIWESLPGLKIVAGRPIDHWNSLLRHEFARAILADAGPDAALIKALESALAIINNEADPGEYAEPLKAIRAALSGAKGN